MGKKTKIQISWKLLVIEPNGVKFGTQGALIEHMWDTFDLVMFKVILRSYDAIEIFLEKKRFLHRCFF